MKARFLALPVLLLAAPLSSIAAMCSVNTLQAYLNMPGACDVGDKQFSEFRYVGVSLLAVAPENITVTPITGTNIGLRFTGPFSVSGINLISETFFSFQVSTINNQPLIRGANLALAASFTGLGAVSVDEQLDFGLLNLRNLNARTSILSTQLTDSITFTPASSFRVSKDIFLLSGALGSASISSIEQTFPQVPEPATAALCVSALTGLVLFHRRRNAGNGKV